MKKLIFIVLFIGFATFSYGQYVPKGKTAKAEMALSQGKLDIAKAEIDEAFRVDDKGKVKNADGADGFKAFRLQINPQELTQDEIFAIQVTPTFRGVLVEHQGVTLKDINITFLRIYDFLDEYSFFLLSLYPFSIPYFVLRYL